MSQSSYFSNILAKKRQMDNHLPGTERGGLFDVRFDKPQEFIQVA